MSVKDINSLKSRREGMVRRMVESRGVLSAIAEKLSSYRGRYPELSETEDTMVQGFEMLERYGPFLLSLPLPSQPLHPDDQALRHKPTFPSFIAPSKKQLNSWHVAFRKVIRTRSGCSSSPVNCSQAKSKGVKSAGGVFVLSFR